MSTPEQDYRTLIAAARRPHDVATLALAGVIAMRSQRNSPYDTPIAGLGERELESLIFWYFPAAKLDFNTNLRSDSKVQREDEFSDLLALLLEHRTIDDEQSLWLAHAIATASMSENHLWQDMGLPNRTTLSELMASYFTPLANRNVRDMKWKKFFYRELCAREGLTLCRSPNCGVCADQAHCFGPEDPVNGSHVLFSSDQTITT